MSWGVLGFPGVSSGIKTDRLVTSITQHNFNYTCIYTITCVVYMFSNNMEAIDGLSSKTVKYKTTDWAPQGGLGNEGEWLFIIRELESTDNYFRGAR